MQYEDKKRTYSLLDSDAGLISAALDEFAADSSCEEQAERASKLSSRLLSGGDLPISTEPAFKFWMVWCSAHGMPNKRHATQSKALVEAERLAKKHPGYKFHVLTVIATAQTQVTEPTWTTEYKVEDVKDQNDQATND